MIHTSRGAVAALTVLVAIAGELQAGVITAPGQFEAASGNGALSTLIRHQARTYQVQIAASELFGIPTGSTLTGLQWRLSSSADLFPSGIATWSDYEITLAQAANPMNGFSPAIADNMLDPVLVRDGPLAIVPGAFPAGGSPNDWGPLITFATPYEYLGGDLVVLYRHTGSDLQESAFLDAVSTSAALGYGTLFRAQVATSFDALSAPFAEFFTITQFEFAPPSTSAIPEPASVALGGIGLMGMLLGAARRRRR